MRPPLTVSLTFATCLGISIGILVALTRLVLGAAVVRAATPTPSPPVGDPRSPGQGPGLVGDPLLAVGVVLVVALAAVLVTLVYVRITPEPGDRYR
ncbi:MAG: hypothetical protein C4343_03240 [Chloroflexota bacterium]